MNRFWEVEPHSWEWYEGDMREYFTSCFASNSGGASQLKSMVTELKNPFNALNSSETDQNIFTMVYAFYKRVIDETGLSPIGKVHIGGLEEKIIKDDKANTIDKTKKKLEGVEAEIGEIAKLRSGIVAPKNNLDLIEERMARFADYKIFPQSVRDAIKAKIGPHNSTVFKTGEYDELIRIIHEPHLSVVAPTDVINALFYAQTKLREKELELKGQLIELETKDDPVYVESSHIWYPYLLAGEGDTVEKNLGFNLHGLDPERISRVLETIYPYLTSSKLTGSGAKAAIIKYSIAWLDILSSHELRTMNDRDLCSVIEKDLSDFNIEGDLDVKHKRERIKKASQRLRDERSVHLEDVVDVARNVIRTVGEIDVDVKPRGKGGYRDVKLVEMPDQFSIGYNERENTRLFDVSLAFYAAALRYDEGYDETVVNGIFNQFTEEKAIFKRVVELLELARFRYRLSKEFPGVNNDLQKLLDCYVKEREKSDYIGGSLYGHDLIDQLAFLLLTDKGIPNNFYSKSKEKSPQRLNEIITEMWQRARVVQNPHADFSTSYKAAEEIIRWVEDNKSMAALKSEKDSGVYLTSFLCLPKLEDFLKTPEAREEKKERKEKAKREQMTSKEGKGKFTDSTGTDVEDKSRSRGGEAYREWAMAKGGNPGKFIENYCLVFDRDEISTHEEANKVEKALFIRDNRAVQRIIDEFELLRDDEVSKVDKLYSGREDHKAAVKYMIGLKRGESPDPKIFYRQDINTRSVAAAILVDISGTSGFASGVDQLRVIDVEKLAMWYTALGLDHLGDDFGLYAFWSNNRERVEVRTLKELGEEFNHGEVLDKVTKLAPHGYSRAGPAVRHVTRKLNRASAKSKLLFFWSDGLPEDKILSGKEEPYKGMYGMVDTRCALVEARATGVHTFGYLLGDRVDPRFFSKMFDGYFDSIENLEDFPRRFAERYRTLTA